MKFLIFSISDRTVGPGKTYNTIQAAISASNYKDTIIVDEGTYLLNETIDIQGKGLIIRSAYSSPANTTIDCNGAVNIALNIYYGSFDSQFIGFTIRNCYHAVVVSNYAGITLSKMIISQNSNRTSEYKV